MKDGRAGLGRGVGGEAQGGQVGVHGLVEPSGAVQDIAPVAVGRRVGRIKRYRLIQLRQGRLRPTQPMQRDAEVVVDRGQPRQPVGGALKQCRRRLVVTLAGPDLAEQVQARPIERANRQMAQDHRLGLRRIEVAGPAERQQAQRLDVVRVLLEHACIGGPGLVHPAGEVMRLPGAQQRQEGGG